MTWSPADEKKIMNILDHSQEYWGDRVTKSGDRMWFARSGSPVKYRCDKMVTELIARGWAQQAGHLLRPTVAGDEVLEAAGRLYRCVREED